MLLVSKICAAVLLACLRLLAGLLPLKVYRKLDKWGRKGDENGNPGRSNQRRKRIDLFLSVFLCFGAGLLLSTCFIHMIPEVRESFERAAASGQWPVLNQFPFAEGVVCLGFFAVYLFEELGELLMNRQSESKDKANEEDCKNGRHGLSVHHSNGGSHIGDDELRSRSSSESGPEGAEHNHNRHHHNQQHGHSHGPAITDLQPKSLTAAVRGFLLVFALSFHSVFEGMAIGLEDTVNDVWFLFAAVTVHELAIMFCIGLEMLASSMKTNVYIAYMVTLGLITPIGVGVGIVVTEYVQDPTPGHTLTIAILQAIAAGTLLFVTFMEVLERERRKPSSGLLKLLAVFLGFSLLSLLEVWGHGGGNHAEEGTADGLRHTHESVAFHPITTRQYSEYVPDVQ